MARLAKIAISVLKFGLDVTNSFIFGILGVMAIGYSIHSK
jgi:hypothetical protein